MASINTCSIIYSFANVFQPLIPYSCLYNVGFHWHCLRLEGFCGPQGLGNTAKLVWSSQCNQLHVAMVFFKNLYILSWPRNVLLYGVQSLSVYSQKLIIWLIFSQLNLVQIFILHFSKIPFNIILPFVLLFSKKPLSFMF